MAVLGPALNKVWRLEGGYSNLSDDPETFLGINRAANPDWPGWQIIETKRDDPTFPRNIEADPELRNLAALLYREAYWKPLRCPDIRSQRVAERLMEIGVHSGIGTAGRLFQRALNALSRNGQLFTKLAEDGKIGPMTMAALSAVLVADTSFKAEHRLLALIESLQVTRYVELTEGSEAPKHSKRIRGYLERLFYLRGEDL